MTKARVLIADDSVLFRNVFVLLLENAGYEVTSVFDGREALNALRASPYDLAILDNEMPNLNGIDALVELRAFLPGMPVVICSGTVSHAQATQYRMLGVSEVFTKPVDPGVLREKIAHIIAGRPSGAAPADDGTANPLTHSTLASPLTAGPSRFAMKLKADLERLQAVRSVAIVEGLPGSGRFELAMNAAPASNAHKRVCHADDLSPEQIDMLLKSSLHNDLPVFLVILDANRLDAPKQVLLEVLTRGELAKYAGMSKRLRLILCAQDSLCDLHFNEFLLMRAMAHTYRLPNFTTRRQDWTEVAKAILHRVSSGRETLGSAALKWIELQTWPGNYMQLHRTIEIARRQARLTSIVSVLQIQSAVASEPQYTEPLFHDMLFHVHSGEA